MYIVTIFEGNLINMKIICIVL